MQTSEVEAGATPPAETTFSHKLKDGSTITVGLPRGVIRLKLRALLGDTYFKDEELKTMATAFLAIRTWSGIPSPLMNPNHFEAMMQRFESDEDLDEFMTKWQRLVQPELTEIVSKALAEAIEQDLSPEETTRYIQNATLPYAKKRLDKLQDLQTTPSS